MPCARLGNSCNPSRGNQLVDRANLGTNLTHHRPHGLSRLGVVGVLLTGKLGVGAAYRCKLGIEPFLAHRRQVHVDPVARIPPKTPEGARA